MSITVEVATVNDKSGVFIHNGNSIMYLGWNELQTTIEQLSAIHIAHIGESDGLQGAIKKGQ
jgi:hypothetical protein